MGNKILGTYNYREGGSIYININDNMKYDTSVNTQIHEMNHMHLDNATTLGNVLKMLEMERCCTPSIDQNHILLIEKYQQIIRRNTSVIQEIYANGIICNLFMTMPFSKGLCILVLLILSCISL